MMKSSPDLFTKSSEGLHLSRSREQFIRAFMNMNKKNIECKTTFRRTLTLPEDHNDQYEQYELALLYLHQIHIFLHHCLEMHHCITKFLLPVKVMNFIWQPVRTRHFKWPKKILKIT